MDDLAKLSRSLLRDLWRASRQATRGRQPQISLIRQRIRSGFRERQGLTDPQDIREALRRG
ncbi:hypothetical protein EV182_001527, partial [Spiromyces aspiralis]